MRPTVLFGSLLVAGLALGCGGGSGGYPTSSHTTSTGGGTTTTGGGTTPASVTVADYSFMPSSVTVKVGTTVTWTNYGGTAHTSTADNGGWDSGQLASATGGAYGMGGSAGGSFSHTFDAVGTFSYHCSNHASMTGTITVTN